MCRRQTKEGRQLLAQSITAYPLNWSAWMVGAAAAVAVLRVVRLAMSRLFLSSAAAIAVLWVRIESQETGL
jgi:hypothetical protein